MTWSVRVSRNTSGGSAAGPAARAKTVGGAEPSLKLGLCRPKPPAPRNHSSQWGIRIPGKRNCSRRLSGRGNRLARSKCRSANSEELRRWLRWKRSWRRRSSTTRGTTWTASRNGWRAWSCLQPTHECAACGSLGEKPRSTQPKS